MTKKKMSKKIKKTKKKVNKKHYFLDPIKKKLGRPLKYKTPEELELILIDYFNEIDFNEWSVTGLALLVGSKQLIQDYEKRGEYKDLIIHAKLMIENSYEISLRKNGRPGDIFALKNFDWKDKQEFNQKIDSTINVIDFSNSDTLPPKIQTKDDE
ncbi:MAG: terminase small subunit [Candidatus Thorarchaeota archaeon]